MLTIFSTFIHCGWNSVSYQGSHLIGSVHIWRLTSVSVKKKTETLVEEIQNALTKLSASSDSASSLSSSCNDVTDVDDNPESATTTASTEKVQNKSSSKSRKRKYCTCPRPQLPPPRLVHQLMICKNPVRSVLFQVSDYNSGTPPQRHPFNTDTSLLWTVHLVHERLKSIYISVKRTPL